MTNEIVGVIINLKATIQCLGLSNNDIDIYLNKLNHCSKMWLYLLIILTKILHLEYGPPEG